MTLLSDPFTIIVACLAVIVVGMAKGGFAGFGTLGAPLLALALPPAVAAAILLPILLVQDVISVWSFRKTWDRWIVGWMLPGAALGVLGGWMFAAHVHEDQLLTALGAITAFFGAYRLWIERGGRIVAASTSPGWVGSVFGMVMGLTSQIAHAGGPPFQMWVAPRRLPHESFVGTGAVLFAAVNWMKVPSYLALGTLNGQTFSAAALLIPLAIASTLVSVRVVRRMDSTRFYTLVYWLMVGLGLKLMWDGLS